jgi:hypothetical protein
MQAVPVQNEVELGGWDIDASPLAPMRRHVAGR